MKQKFFNRLKFLTISLLFNYLQHVYHHIKDYQHFNFKLQWQNSVKVQELLDRFIEWNKTQNI